MFCCLSRASGFSHLFAGALLWLLWLSSLRLTLLVSPNAEGFEKLCEACFEVFLKVLGLPVSEHLWSPWSVERLSREVSSRHRILQSEWGKLAIEKLYRPLLLCMS